MTETITMLPPEALLADSNARFGLKPYRVLSLSRDIMEAGRVLVPLTVEELPDSGPNGETHRVTMGHYRRAAVEKLNKEGAGLLLPCQVEAAGTTKDRLRNQLRENLERESLSPMDKAVAIKQMEDAGFTKQDIREAFSVLGGRKGLKIQPASNSYINMHLSFLEFPKSIQTKIHDGTIGVGGAYELHKAKPDKWNDIVAELESDRQKAIDVEEKDEESYLKGEAKAAEQKAKLDTLQAELEAAQKEEKEALEAKKLKAAEASEAYTATKLEAEPEAKKAAEEAFKAKEKEDKAAEKAVADAKKKASALEEKATKLKLAAAERTKKLEDARKAAKKPASGKDVQKAAKKVGETTGVVLLNANEMRNVINDWADLPGSYPKIQAIMKLVQKVFKSELTPNQGYSKIAIETGEKKSKA